MERDGKAENTMAERKLLNLLDKNDSQRRVTKKLHLFPHLNKKQVILVKSSQHSSSLGEL